MSTQTPLHSPTLSRNRPTRGAHWRWLHGLRRGGRACRSLSVGSPSVIRDRNGAPTMKPSFLELVWNDDRFRQVTSLHRWTRHRKPPR